MSILVVAEHDNTALKPVTLNVIAAAKKLGGDLDVLVAGTGCKSVAEQAAAIGGLGDASNQSRNIVLAFTAGIATLLVHAYRNSRRKLASAARAAHLDPLAAWLDDPRFDAE